MEKKEKQEKRKKKFAERSVLTLDKEISFFAECNYLALNVQHLKYIKNNFEKYEIKKIGSSSVSDLALDK
jgi:hypothetical protein